MDIIVMVAQILLSISILVGIHEFGHLLAAKYFGMRVEQFSIGFPPKLFKFKYGETEYALSAIPLGGFVKISGMIDESLDTEKLKEEPQHFEFRAKPAWQRLIVMLGGIIVNVGAGVLIFILITFLWGDKYVAKDMVNENGGIYAQELAREIGLQTGDQVIKINGQDYYDFMEVFNPANFLTDNPFYTVKRGDKVLDVAIPADFLEHFSDKNVEFVTLRVPAIVGEISKNSLADRIGLQVDDQFIEMEGVPVSYTDEVRTIMAGLVSDSIRFSILRGQEKINFSESLQGDSVIGFGASVSLLKSYEKSIDYSLGESLSLGTSRAFGIVFLQIKAFGKMFSGDLNVRKSLSGPIGIAQAYGTEWDWHRFWRMTGLLSMVLAFMNLLPIPALDGGHVMFLSAEIISGRKPSDKFLEVAQKIGMIILLALMVFIFSNDILKLFNI